jgi:hypothetical protein
MSEPSKIDAALDWIKSIFKSDPNKELIKAKANRDKVKEECTKKIGEAELAVEKVSSDIKKEDTAPTGGKSSRRKGTRKSNGKKNKKTRRN